MDSSSENPFRSPPELNPASPASPYDGPSTQSLVRSRVREVPVVGWLMIIHGLLIVLVGIAVGAMAAAMIFAFDPAKMEEELGSPAMMTFVSVMYGAVALVLVGIGITQTLAGWRIKSYRSRTLGIVALSVGLVVSMTVWCAPTAIALAVYGLMVLMNPPVMGAFQRVQQGTSLDDLKRQTMREYPR